MNIQIVCVGKLKEKYWRDACEEYIKRLGAYCNVSVVELKESRLTGEGEKAELAVKEAEGRDMLAKLGGSSHASSARSSSSRGTGSAGSSGGLQGSDSYIIALDVRGKKLSSEGLAEKLDDLALNGKSNLSLLIGGSLGLSDEVLARADYRLSFSDMTFPHQMMRVILLEQIYRAFKINRGETYHK